LEEKNESVLKFIIKKVRKNNGNIISFLPSRKKECDFIVEGKQAIQVSYELSQQNEEREIKLQNFTIKVMPAWKSLINLQ
jgi:hypothetical protein